MSQTNIEWADFSWNPYAWMCNKVSEGCANCYMMTWAARLGKFPVLTDGTAMLTRWPAALRELAAMPAGAVIFVNSMSDTYHPNARAADIHRIHNTALAHPNKTFLVLTKRPERAYAMRHTLAWPGNLWLGVSVEMMKYRWRIEYALATPAAGVFVSAEPLLENITPSLALYLHPDTACLTSDVRVWPHLAIPYRRRVGWVIVGGESGKDRRPFNPDWARGIRDACVRHGVPYMFKQGSAHSPGQDRRLDGRTWDETPFGAMVDRHAGPAPLILPSVVQMPLPLFD